MGYDRHQVADFVGRAWEYVGRNQDRRNEEGNRVAAHEMLEDELDGPLYGREPVGRGDPAQGDVYNDRRAPGGTQPRRDGPSRRRDEPPPPLLMDRRKK